ncbi:unnamed protein product, partial [Phaeothamnion confervicola]
MVAANALWALGNLAWHWENQERIGRFAPLLLRLACHAELVRANALACLANALHYHSDNRARVEAARWGGSAALWLLVHFSDDGSPPRTQVAALRCLVSLSYEDAAAVALVVTAVGATAAGTGVQHAAALVLLNVCAHPDNKAAVVASAPALEAVMALQASDDQRIRNVSDRILATLADFSDDPVPEPEEHLGGGGDRRHALSCSTLLNLVAAGGSTRTRSMAAEALADRLWQRVDVAAEAAGAGAVELLLGVSAAAANAVLTETSLRALCNCLRGCPRAQNKFHAVAGMERLSAACAVLWSSGRLAAAEGALTAAAAACAGHPPNCRRLLRVGLDGLLDVAEGKGKGGSCNGSGGGDGDGSGGGGQPAKAAAAFGTACAGTATAGSGNSGGGRGRCGTGRLAMSVAVSAAAAAATATAAAPTATVAKLSAVEDVVAASTRRAAAAAAAGAEANCRALASGLLSLLGPYNYVVCGNCKAREAGGLTCQRCGHSL